jgi:hypothetical protein
MRRSLVSDFTRISVRLYDIYIKIRSGPSIKYVFSSLIYSMYTRLSSFMALCTVGFVMDQYYCKSKLTQIVRRRPPILKTKGGSCLNADSVTDRRTGMNTSKVFLFHLQSTFKSVYYRTTYSPTASTLYNCETS